MAALQGPGHSQHVSDESQQDPTIRDTRPSRVGPTETLALINGIPRSSSPLSDSPGGRPPLLRITTSPPLQTRSSGGPGTAYFTPGASREVRDSRTFDSAATVRVEFSDPNSGSQNVAKTDHKVVDVQPAPEWVRSKHLLSIRPLEPPRRKGSGRRSNAGPDSVMADVEPRHGLRIPLAPPSRSSPGFSYMQELERQRDSTFSFSSSPFDQFRGDTGPSRRIPEVENPTIPIPGRESGSRQTRSKLPSRDEGSDVVSGGEAAFPRSGTKRVVPGWGDTKGMSEGRHEEKGKERGDCSYQPTTTVSDEVEAPSWDQNSLPVSPTRPTMGYTTQDAVSILVQRSDPSFVKLLLTKVRGSSQLVRPPLLLNRAPSPARKNERSSKPEPNKGGVRATFKSIFGSHKGRVD